MLPESVEGVPLLWAYFLSYGFSGIAALYWILLGTGVWLFQWRQKKLRLQASSSLPEQEASFLPSSYPSFPPLSVLIAAHNAEATLPSLLHALLTQHYPAPYEIVVVADRCTDRTELLLQEIAQRSPVYLQWRTVQTVPEGWSPKKYALLQATEMAQYDWCVLVDADTILPEGWLTELLRVSTGKNAVVAPAWLLPDRRISSQIASYEAALVQAETVGWAALCRPYMATGRGWAIRKAWLRAGLFRWRRELSGDDDLTFQLLPSSAIALSLSPTYSEAPKNFTQAARRKWRHLQTARQYSWPLRLRLAIAPLCQMLGFLAVFCFPFTAGALLLPPLAKAYALRAAGWRFIGKGLLWDLPLLFLQSLYPLGVWLRRQVWVLLCIFTLSVDVV